MIEQIREPCKQYSRTTLVRLASRTSNIQREFDIRKALKKLWNEMFLVSL